MPIYAIATLVGIALTVLANGIIIYLLAWAFKGLLIVLGVAAAAILVFVVAGLVSKFRKRNKNVGQQEPA